MGSEGGWRQCQGEQVKECPGAGPAAEIVPCTWPDWRLVWGRFTACPSSHAVLSCPCPMVSAEGGPGHGQGKAGVELTRLLQVGVQGGLASCRSASELSQLQPERGAADLGRC